MRLVYDNLADSATLSASSVSGSLVVDNMKNNYRAKVWRSTGTSAVLTAVFSAPQFVSMVSMPFCNLTSTSYMRVKLFSDAAGTTAVYDSGNVLAVPPASFGNFGWGSEPLGVNHYTYSGVGVYATHWVTAGHVTCRRVEISITDSQNSSGYIEASRLVIGSHWSPEVTADVGVQLGFDDRSSHSKTQSGDTRTTLRPRKKTLNFNLGSLTDQEGAKVFGILNGIPLGKLLFVSLFPENQDSGKEQAYQMFGRRSKVSAVVLAQFNAASHAFALEEI